MSFKQKLIVLAVVIIMPMLVLASNSNPDTETNPGLTVTWTFNVVGGNATITGTTPTNVLTGDITIPGSVTDATSGTTYVVTSITGLGNGIKSNSNITSVAFPLSIQSIVTSAFTMCKGLKGDLDLSGLTNLTEIGTNAFDGCSGFTGKLTLPASLTTIGGTAFRNCMFTGDLVIPDKVTTLGTYAFNGCSGFNGTLTLPPLITTIGLNTFQNCSNLSGTLVLPGGLTTIETSAFTNCSKLGGDIVIPASLTSIKSFPGGTRSITFTAPALDLTNISIPANSVILEYIDMSACTLGVEPTSFARNSGPLNLVRQNTLIYLPQGTPESLVPASPINYILDGMCDQLVIDDGYDYFIPHDFTATTATYSRSFAANTIGTIYLPFQFTLDGTSHTGYALAGHKNKTPGPNGTITGDTFVFWQKPAGNLYAANTPYLLVGGKSASVIPVVSTTDGAAGVKVSKSPVGVNHDGVGNALSNPNVAGTGITDNNGVTWNFYGTAEKIDNATAYGWNAYNLNVDRLWHPITPANTAGFVGQVRGFIASDTPDVSAKEGGFAIEFVGIDGNPTGISTVGSGYDNSVETRIYNIGGQYVGSNLSALPKGMYIVNGKKVIKREGM